MRELCIPIPSIPEGEVADIIFRVEDKEETYSFKLESLPWMDQIGDDDTDDGNLNKTLDRILKLREYITALSIDWELIQIYTPEPGAQHIKVLFRKRKG
jgi:hypothetical protein